jgi:Zn finger protein HypA/HybF involved in hydrogenase expression
MPSKVIHLRTPQSPTEPSDDATPHATGQAICLHCQHSWVAIAPVGTIDLECPECKLPKGAFNYACVPPDDVKVWECHCGNQLFYITPEGHWCPNCGNYNGY